MRTIAHSCSPTPTHQRPPAKGRNAECTRRLRQPSCTHAQVAQPCTSCVVRLGDRVVHLQLHPLGISTLPARSSIRASSAPNLRAPSAKLVAPSRCRGREPSRAVLPESTQLVARIRHSANKSSHRAARRCLRSSAVGSPRLTITRGRRVAESTSALTQRFARQTENWVKKLARVELNTQSL